jgi:hypothetical protein
MAEPAADQGPEASRLLFRYLVHEWLRARVRPGSRLLNLGCGDGGDALTLAAHGVRVLGLDASEVAVQRARRRALAAGLGSCLRFHVRRPYELRIEDGTFDAALAGFDALDWTDLPGVGRALAAVLRPDAPVTLALPAPRPAAARYGAREDAERRLGPEFAWTRGFGLGIFLPSRTSDAWPERHPHAFAALAALESLVRERPLWRNLGAYLVLTGTRR